MAPEPRDRRIHTPVTRVAGASMVLLLVLTGTVAAAGPGSLATDSGRRSAAMLMATLQEAARQLANAEEGQAPRACTPPAVGPRVLCIAPQTPRHTSPLGPTLCVLPPPAG